MPLYTKYNDKDDYKGFHFIESPTHEDMFGKFVMVEENDTKNEISEESVIVEPPTTQEMFGNIVIVENPKIEQPIVDITKDNQEKSMILTMFIGLLLWICYVVIILLFNLITYLYFIPTWLYILVGASICKSKLQKNMISIEMSFEFLSEVYKNPYGTILRLFKSFLFKT